MGPKIAKSEMRCQLCGKPIAIGNEYVRHDGIRAHTACHAGQQSRLKELSRGGQAGGAKGGRVIRGTNNLGG